MPSMLSTFLPLASLEFEKLSSLLQAS